VRGAAADFDLGVGEHDHRSRRQASRMFVLKHRVRGLQGRRLSDAKDFVGSLRSA
jgi:hypothetical protein